MDWEEVPDISSRLGDLRRQYAETADPAERAQIEQQYEAELDKLPPEERRFEAGLLGGDVFDVTEEGAG